MDKHDNEDMHKVKAEVKSLTLEMEEVMYVHMCSWYHVIHIHCIHVPMYMAVNLYLVHVFIGVN